MRAVRGSAGARSSLASAACAANAMQRRRPVQPRIGGLRRQRVHGEAELGGQHRAPRAGEHLRQHHQQFVRAIAQHDAGTVDAVPRGQRRFQVAAERIRVAVQVDEAVERGLTRRRARSDRVLVGAQFDQPAGRPGPAQGDDVQAGVVGAQAADAGRGERGEVRCGPCLGFRQSRATG
jgi:hypothetical protein